MSTERRIKTLKTRQKSLLTSFGLIKAFVDGFKEETGAREVAVRLEHLVAIWNDFNATQAELETLDEAAIEAHLKERIEFETAYFRVKGFLLAVNKTEPTSPRTSSSSSLTTQIPPSSHVRLPDIKLPVFAGNLDQWLNFHDLFVSLVHSSHELSNIQKFYYLRSSLSGDALKLVQTIALSANNYQVAWNLLLDHYQNPVRLKQSYVDSLFEFPFIKKESASELHSLVERFEANVKVLHQLGEKTEYWDILLIRMLSIRLDPTTRRDWEEHASTLNAVSFQNLTTFIQRRVSVLQTIGKTTDIPPPINTPKKPTQRVVASHGASPTYQRKCVACSDHHPLYQCVVFSQLSPDEKEREVHRHQLCRNCLRKGHTVKECSSSSTCRKCRGRHHTQLCQGSAETSTQLADSPQPEENTSQQSTEQPSASVSATLDKHASCASAERGRTSVLLATAIVIVVDDNGTEHTARALLDSGSECYFTTESFSQLVKAQRKRIHLPIAGIGQSSTESRFKFLSKIRSRVCQYSTTVELLVLPKVAIDLPSTAVDTSSWKIPPGIQLADPAFCRSSSIDLILGAEVFFELFKVSGRIQLGPGLPTLINSVFGWVVSGRSSQCPSSPIVSNVAIVANLDTLNQKLCPIEEDTSSYSYKQEEDEGHMELAQNYQRPQQPSHHLLQNGVIRKDSTTTEIKPTDLQSIIMRFRIPPFQLYPNASKMQQHIVWFPSLEAPLQTNEPAIVEAVPIVTVESAVPFDKDQRIWFHSESSTTILRYKTQRPPTSTDNNLTNQTALFHIARLVNQLGQRAPAVKPSSFSREMWTADTRTQPNSGKDLLSSFRIRWESYLPQVICINKRLVQHCVVFSSPTSLPNSRQLTADNLVEIRLLGSEWPQHDPNKSPTSKSIPNQLKEVILGSKKFHLTAFPSVFIDQYVRMPWIIAEELIQPKSKLINLVQQHFGSESTESRQPALEKSRLQCLHSSFDVNGINGQPLMYSVNQPTSYARSLAGYFRRHLYKALRLLLALLRSRYGIIGARDVVKRIVHSCMECFRNHPKIIETLRAAPRKATQIVVLLYIAPMKLSSPNQSVTKTTPTN